VYERFRFPDTFILIQPFSQELEQMVLVTANCFDNNFVSSVNDNQRKNLVERGDFIRHFQQLLTLRLETD